MFYQSHLLNIPLTWFHPYHVLPATPFRIQVPSHAVPRVLSQFSHPAVSDSLGHHGLQHARLPCSSPTPRAYSNSFPLSQWYHPTIYLILCRPLLLLPSIFPSIRVFSNESVLLIRWPKYCSFSFNISLSNEYSGLISLRMDLSPCSPRDSQESSPIPQFKSINSSTLSFLYSPTLISIHDYWKNHSFD